MNFEKRSPIFAGMPEKSRLCAKVENVDNVEKKLQKNYGNKTTA